MSADPQPLRLIEGNDAYTSYLLISGCRVDPEEAAALFRAVVLAEVRNWVPDVSQRLIRRAGAVLIEQSMSIPEEPDHGPDRSMHNVVHGWVGGLYLACCAGCHRLFPV